MLVEPKIPLSRSTQPIDVNTWLMASLAFIATGAMIAAAGFAKVFVATEPMPFGSTAWKLLVSGTAMVVASVACTLHLMQRLPEPRDDCDQYGRHIFGLTFVLLLVGLCNAVGTSMLALDGGLGFSAAALIEAGDPQNVEKADQRHAKAQEDLKVAERNVAAAERANRKAQEAVALACAGPEADACARARVDLARSADAVEDLKLARNDALQTTVACQTSCEEVRRKSKRALFFLLSLSTMMSLFGASFYVVNRVRSKRAARAADSGGDGRDDDLAASPDSELTQRTESPPWPASAAGGRGSTTPGAVGRQETEWRKGEPFDVHKFWSGAFFRVGEAVLFTFAFFWLIWTSNRRTDVVWLPVLGLFVGMFVKMGEAIVFRLGMRVLSAVEAFLPTVPTSRAPEPKAKAASQTNQPAPSNRGGGTP